MKPFAPKHSYYFHAAWERFKDAGLLRRDERFVAAIHLFGVAAECMVRAWMPTPHFEGRHDLRDLLASSRLLEGLNADAQRAVVHATRDLMLVWNNSRRYESASKVARDLWGVALPARFKTGKNTQSRVLEAGASICASAADTIIRVGDSP